MAPSDASDSASQYSDDGLKSSNRKKKSARVSFDEEPVIVGRAVTPPLDPTSPPIMSPQHKLAKSRTWIDLIREQSQGSIGSNQDDNNTIKPTPTLPSFGSVRGRDQKSSKEVQGLVNTRDNTVPETSRSVNVSTDNAVGHVIAAETIAKQSRSEPPKTSAPDDPIPPQVTSVEGSGYQSDEGELFNEQEINSAPQPAPDLLQAPRSASPSARVTSLEDPVNAHVPSIAVQPATPAMDGALANRNSWLGMPGEFPPQKDGELEPSLKRDTTEHQTPATAGIAEPDPEAVAAQHNSSTPVVGEVAQTLRTQIDNASGDESEESATDSIYSDAAEDQSDLEGDGFGSINAIVESPTSPDIGLANRSPPASPRRDQKADTVRPEPVKQQKSVLSEPEPSEGWDRAQAYWSGLSQTRKQQLEQAALPGAIDEPIIRDRSMRGANAMQKKYKKKGKKLTQQPLSDGNSPQQTRSPSLKSSMRSSSPQVDSSPHLRSSMRNGSPGPTAKTSDKGSSVSVQNKSRNDRQRDSRPVSAVAMVDYRKSEQRASPSSTQISSPKPSAMSKDRAPVQQQKKASVAKPKMQRGNSDSDSSFKKVQSKSPVVKKYTMKRSMRGQSGGQEPNRTTSMSIRTSSPAESTTRRPFSSVGASGAGGMRTSMRGSVDLSKPGRTSLRKSVESSKTSRPKSPSRFSFITSSKAKPVTTDSQIKPRFASRFGDSSDEDGLPTMTSSRFADSSDDDEDPSNLAPVRGIPRRINEGDSTDLDDSSEEKVAATAKSQVEVSASKAQQASRITSPEGAALATGSLRTPPGAQPPTSSMGAGLQAKKAAEKEKTRRSFFGSLSGRKREESLRVPNSYMGDSAQPETEVDKRRQDQMTGVPETSQSSVGAMRSDSPLKGSMMAKKTDAQSQTGSQTSMMQNSPKSPKLQRRNTPKRITSSNDISWPLAQSSAASADNMPRPRTSDGPSAIQGDARPRPSLVLRHSVQAPVQGPLTNGAASTSTDPHTKKKKFSMLRKAFGLHK